MWQQIIQKVQEIFAPFTLQYIWIADVRYIFFIALLAILYIANSRYAENNLQHLNSLKENLKESRWRYTASQKRLMNKSRQTEVAKNVVDLDLQELSKPPKKIIIPTQ